MRDFLKVLFQHDLMESDLRIYVKDYRPSLKLADEHQRRMDRIMERYLETGRVSEPHDSNATLATVLHRAGRSRWPEEATALIHGWPTSSPWDLQFEIGGCI